MKLEIKNLNHIVSTQYFKFILLSMIMLAFYGAIFIAYTINGYIPAFLTILGNTYFEMFLLFILLYNTYQTLQNFDKNSNYIIRLGTKKDYLKHVITKAVKNNIFIYLIQISFIIILLNFIYGNNLAITTMYNDSINNFVYLLFFILKSIVLYSIITVISVILLKLIPSQIAISVHAVLYVMIPAFSVIDYHNRIDSLLKFKFFIGDYLTTNNIYVNFFFELCCTGIYILMLLIIVQVLFKYSIRHIKEIG